MNFAVVDENNVLQASGRYAYQMACFRYWLIAPVIFRGMRGSHALTNTLPAGGHWQSSAYVTVAHHR